MPSANGPLVALYLLDQDRSTTSSLGIFHYSRNLVRGIAETPNPGLRFSVWVSSANEDDLVPESVPDWMRIVRVRGRFGDGFRRLAADHLLAARLALRHAPDVAHFPKGWLPACWPRTVRRVATLHDTIVQFYRRRYPGFFPASKMFYFHRMALRTLRRADHIVTSSRFSAGELEGLALPRHPPMSIIPPAGVGEAVAVPMGARRGIFVIGSPMPHKATAETLRRLDAYAAAAGFTEPVTVAGVADIAAIPGAVRPKALRVEFAGRLPSDALKAGVAGSRVLVVLSEIEGFGLPLLEAYSLFTPVCFRDTTSMSEVLEGAPGAWDGRGDESFRGALDECLNLSMEQVAAIRANLARRYDWRRSVEETLDVYRRLPEKRRRRGG